MRKPKSSIRTRLWRSEPLKSNSSVQTTNHSAFEWVALAIRVGCAPMHSVWTKRFLKSSSYTTSNWNMYVMQLSTLSFGELYRDYLCSEIKSPNSSCSSLKNQPMWII